MATKYDLEITQGTRYYVRLEAVNDDGTPIDLNSYALSGQVRHQFGSSGILLNLPLTAVPDFEESGYFDLIIPAGTAADLPVVKAVYDIEIVSGNNTTQLIYGYFNVYPEVTR